MMEQKLFLLCAGGTGGHLFPALALAAELQSRGAEVHLATDKRAIRYANSFQSSHVHMISSSSIGSKNPFTIAKALWALFKGIRQSARLIRTIRPDAIIGFGGYPSIPPLLAASQADRPTILHEQNAIMGRANKMLAKRVTAIAGGFLPPDKGLYKDKTMITGNPVRSAIIEAAAKAYKPSLPDDIFNLVVFGGSQGARFFGQILPQSLSLMSLDARKRLNLTLQAREEDIDKARLKCAELGVKADISPFFDNLAERIGHAHLVISRSGASSVSELAAIGRPAILIPYPYGLDHDQAANAKTMLEKGGAEVIAQSDLDGKKMAELIENHINNPQNLAKIAANAKHAGTLNATSLLADLVEAIAKGRSIKEFKDQNR